MITSLKGSDFFLRYRPVVRGIHRSPVGPLKGQWRGALMFSLVCAWTKSWANDRDADATVMGMFCAWRSRHFSDFQLRSQNVLWTHHILSELSKRLISNLFLWHFKTLKRLTRNGAFMCSIYVSCKISRIAAVTHLVTHSMRQNIPHIVCSTHILIWSNVYIYLPHVPKCSFMYDFVYPI